jgi:N-formylglutamate deformylase
VAEPAWSIVPGDGPLVATAIHHGHAIREELRNRCALSEAERLREEDPFTGEWTAVAGARVVVHRSRFEVDLNRPRARAVYLEPGDAWGLEVWREPPTPEMVDLSRSLHDSFYAELTNLLREKVARHGRFVLFDLHSYNHRRAGPEGPPAAPEENPEVNVGTGNLDREPWTPVVDAFLTALGGFDFRGRRLDVRENVKFRGGYVSKWVQKEFPGTGCALAIEFKKFFMDEWTGQPVPETMETIVRALASTVSPVLAALARVEPPA